MVRNQMMQDSCEITNTCIVVHCSVSESLDNFGLCWKSNLWLVVCNNGSW